MIHEGQLTYADAGLHKLLDLGVVVADEHGLPLPLGVVAHPRATSSAATTSPRCCARRSTPGSRTARTRSRTRCGFGRGIDARDRRRFVAMYVNDLTLDMGERGRAAVTLPARAARAEKFSAVILSAVRTPVGRYGGGLAGVRPDDLAAIACARRSSARACRRSRSRTSGSAARTRPARTTATSRAWRCCSQGCPSRSPA